MVRALLLWMVLNCTWLIGCTNRLVALYLCRFYEVIIGGRRFGLVEFAFCVMVQVKKTSSEAGT